MAVNFTTADRVGVVGGYLGGISSLLGNNGLLGWGNMSEGDRPISRYEMNLLKESMAKDSEIALLKSEQNTEIKIADVYERVMTRVNADRAAQAEVNAAQAVYNATNAATVGSINTQVAQLMAMTKMVIPADNVCPRPMDKYNSWTAPTT